MFVAVLGSLAAFVAVSSLLLWAAGSRGVSAETRLKQLTPTRRMISDATFGERIVVPVLGGFTAVPDRAAPARVRLPCKPAAGHRRPADVNANVLPRRNSSRHGCHRQHS